MSVAVGSPAPDFELRNQHGQIVRLSGLRGSPVVLVFFPYAFTGVCSSELSAVQRSLSDFSAAGARVLALSTDTMYALRVFADQLGLGFELLSDFWPHGSVATRYGVFDQDLGCAVRGSFVIDSEGIIIWSVRNAIGSARDIGEHLDAVRA
jgi:peroxiredoxin